MYLLAEMVHLDAWADPEGDRGSGPPPEISHKHRVSKQFWLGSPEKSQSY